MTDPSSRHKSRTFARGALVALVVSLTAALAVSPARAEDKAARVRVVATFSILGDLAQNVGGDRVDVNTLVGINGDIHVYVPTAADAQSVGSAKLLIINGLGLEGWLPRLFDSSGSKARMVTASDGVVPREIPNGSRHHAEGSADPHAWQSVKNVETYVANIRDAMIAVDPAGADTYKANADAYLTKLGALDDEVRAAVARIPPDRRKVISTHSAFGYFAADYDIAFLAPQGISTDSEPSARDVADIVVQIRTQHIPAVFMENISDHRLIRQIASEAGASVGGMLYSDSLTEPGGEAPTYIDMVKHNIGAITKALAGQS